MNEQKRKRQELTPITPRHMREFGDAYSHDGSLVYEAILEHGYKTQYAIPYDRGFVYLMWAKESSVFKIGKSNNPIRRAEEVNKASLKMPFTVQLVGYLHTPFMSKAESLLHRQFSDFRMQGEWFNLTVQQADFFFSESCANLVKAAYLNEIYLNCNFKKDLDEWLEKYSAFKPENIGAMSIGLIENIYSQAQSDIVPTVDYVNSWTQEHKKSVSKNIGGQQ